MSDWLNPINKIKLGQAIKAKRNIVQLDDKVYTIDYKKRPGVVWVEPIHGVVPCGWFSVDDIGKENWFN
jgi:hypothetical protein